MKTAIIHHIKVVVLGSFLLLNLVLMGYSQESTFQFEKLQLSIGEDVDFASHVTEDNTGFIWITTTNGLYRFDGYSFTHFTHNSADSTSLSSNWVENIYIDHQGTMWVGTFGGGLNKFNPETETFTHFRFDPTNPQSISQDSVTVILEDHLNQLWVGTHGGLNKLNRETNTFKRFKYDESDSTSLGNDQVRVLYEDSEGTLWVGTNSAFEGERDNPGPGGLNRLNRESSTFKRFLHDSNDPRSISSNHVMSISEDSRGNFWVGTMGNALHKMDRENGDFERFIYNPATPSELQIPTFSSFSSSCSPATCGGVSIIDEYSSNSLWIGFFGEGLFLLNQDTNSLTPIELNPTSDNSNFSSFLWDLYQSKDGSRWISIFFEGIFKTTLQKQPFEFYSSLITLSGLYASDLGTLWVSNLNELYSFKTAAGEPLSYQRITSTETSPGISESTIATIYEDHNGTLWIGGYLGTVASQIGSLYTVNPQTGEVLSNVLDTIDTQQRIGPIMDMYSTESSLWLGTKYTGLFRLDFDTNSITHYGNETGNFESLSDNNITFIKESKSEPGNLWIGTENGLNRFDLQSETFKRFLHNPDETGSLNGNNITHIYEDSDTQLWIGTRSGGLNRLDLGSGLFEYYSVYNSGLQNNHIACILPDNEGNLWLGTEEGITRFEPENEFFFTYGEQHGVQAGPFVNECVQDSDGRLIFGGVNGFQVFKPDEIRVNSSPSRIVLTNFILNDQPVRFEQMGLLKKPLYMTKKIQLTHNQNSFAFEFSVLDYRDPESNQYAYKLEGYDENWHETGNLRLANFENIPPGDYQFRVRAANSDGVWNHQDTSILVTILPPWWQTWWAYLFYALIFGAGVFAVDRFQRRRLIKKEREKARERELEQAREIEKAYHNLEVAHENLKSAQEQLVQQKKLASLGQLTAGIAHEIKNPLNFVNNFSDLSIELVNEARDEIKEKLSADSSQLTAILDDIEGNLKTIHKHGTRADGIVKSMLQHSRGGSGKMEPTNVNALIKEYANLAFHGMRAGKDPINVDIELDLDKNVGEVEMMSEDFSRVILNLCNNAFDAMRDKLSAVSSQQSADSPFEGGSGDGSPGDYEPKLSIRTYRNDGAVAIEIEDNGPGIPEEIKDKILQPFFTTKKGTAGTGLGLSITNDIIKAHGGALTIESKINNFTRFIIQLEVNK